MKDPTFDMFDDAARAAPPIASRRDPVTAKAAAHDYSRVGRGKDLQLMFNLIKEMPGKTAAEYALVCKDRGMDWYKAAQMPQKRISDLVRRRLIIEGKPRVCSKNNRIAHVYYIAPQKSDGANL